MKVGEQLYKSMQLRPVLRQVLMACADVILITVSIVAAVRLHGDGKVMDFLVQYWPSLTALLALRMTAFYFCDLYRWSFAYASMHDFLSIARAIFYSSAAFVLLLQLVQPNFSWEVRLIEAGTSLFLLTAFRYSRRIAAHTQHSTSPRKVGKLKKVLIYGAGDSGERIAREMKRSPELGYLPLGFIEDDPNKQHISVHSFEVLGSKTELPHILKETNAEELIIAIPSATGKVMRDVIAMCDHHNVRIKKLAPFQEVLGDTFNLKQLSEVALEDLLGRDPVKLDLNEICSYLQGKVIMVTGGAGSIGSELCRQVLRYGAKKLIVVDHNENKGHLLMLELSRHTYADNNTEIRFDIADVRDAQRVQKIFREHEPDVIFHAAAHKHVPVMEQHPDEAVKNNVVGTRIVAQAAHDFHAERFIMVSTDKAVNPQSAMGITKRIAELIVQDFARVSKTKFNSVRFGNVLGSDGSVIPIFREQILRGGPITVTHPDVTRYFMTIPEAVQLLIQAAALGTGGEIFILDMGEPVKVIDLAKNLITLSGMVPNRDIAITFIGLRPGEKLYEELVTAEEGVTKTSHEKVFRVRAGGFNSDEIRTRIQKLVAAADANDRNHVRVLLKNFARYVNELTAIAAKERAATESPSLFPVETR